MSKNTENAKSALKFVPITAWIPTDEATATIKGIIADESNDIKKGEIKKSSYRFKNGKDKTDGYICKVLVIETKVSYGDEEEVEPEAEA